MIKAILFDLDETLLNQNDASVTALRAFHRIHCASLTWERIHERWNLSIQTHFEKYIRGEMTFQQQRRCRIRDIFENQDLSDESADDLFSTYLSEYEKNYSLFPEVLRVLGGLEKYPMGIISNGETRQQHAKLERMGIHACFQAVLISEEVGVRKPDARIFEMAASRLEVSPGECLFIGDNFEADYLGSQGAGMVPVLIERGGRKAPGGTRIITTFDEIPGLLEGFAGEGGV